MKNIEHKWELVADKKATDSSKGWDASKNQKLRQARINHDNGTYFMVTRRKGFDSFEIWARRKDNPTKPHPYFSLTMTEKSALYDKTQNAFLKEEKRKKREPKRKKREPE